MPPPPQALQSFPLDRTASSPDPADSHDSLLRENRRITEGYIQLAGALQGLLDPRLRPGAPSPLRANWYAYAPHASHAAGKGLYCTAMARRLINTGRSRPAVPMEQQLKDLGVTQEERKSTEIVCRLLMALGVPAEAALTLGVLLSALNWKALLDPRTSAIVASRFATLYLKTPGVLPLDKTERLVHTLERTLYEGNVAIFTDIGGSGDAFFRWRASQQGQLTPGRVLAGFSRPGSHPEQARHAYHWALVHAGAHPRPTDFARLLPEVSTQSLVVAAFALYEESRLAPGLAAREAIIAMANNFVAWREQATVVQPSFAPPAPLPGEVSRPEVMLSMTPLLRVDFGTIEWNFSDYASTLPDRDNRFLTSQPTEYNWAIFEDRWPAILDAFEKGYLEPVALWKTPEPLVD